MEINTLKCGRFITNESHPYIPPMLFNYLKANSCNFIDVRQKTQRENPAYFSCNLTKIKITSHLIRYTVPSSSKDGKIKPLKPIKGKVYDHWYSNH
ncbi:hypothetical protein [Enterovibrio norvegicus]|uniref:hypothetical protein n=1 Tax=Enterovibrio norvegicus TaxID=188144 RepID=UPI0024B1D839|nr:hypothetical protein [Enterovibrio norvegicus]